MSPAAPHSSGGILVDLTPREGRHPAAAAVLLAALAGLLVWVPLSTVMQVGTGGARAVLGVLIGAGCLALLVMVHEVLVFPRVQTVELAEGRVTVHTANRLGEQHWSSALEELTSVDLLGEVLLLRRRDGVRYLQLHGQSTRIRLALRDLLREARAAPGDAPSVPESLRSLVAPSPPEALKAIVEP